MLCCDPAEVKEGIQTHSVAGMGIQAWGYDGGSLLIKCHEAAIKEGVKMGAEEEAVEDVQSFRVGRAFGPWLRVAGAEDFRDGNAGDGAGTAPVVHQGLAEEVLPSALFDKGEDFGRARWMGVEFGDLGCVVLGRLVRQGHRQFSGTTQQAAQGGFASGLECVTALVLVGQAADEFSSGRALGKGHLPDHGCLCWRDAGLGLVPGGIHDHSLRCGVPNIFPAVGVAGFFDDCAFEGVH